MGGIKRATHQTKVLEFLKKNRRHGAFNYQLSAWNVGGVDFRVAISKLRKKGHIIECVRMPAPSSATKYYLRKSK